MRYVFGILISIFLRRKIAVAPKILAQNFKENNADF
jgi:hypothetical protein